MMRDLNEFQDHLEMLQEKWFWLTKLLEVDNMFVSWCKKNVPQIEKALGTTNEENDQHKKQQTNSYHQAFDTTGPDEVAFNIDKLEKLIDFAESQSPEGEDYPQPDISKSSASIISASSDPQPETKDSDNDIWDIELLGYAWFLKQILAKFSVHGAHASDRRDNAKLWEQIELEIWKRTHGNMDIEVLCEQQHIMNSVTESFASAIFVHSKQGCTSIAQANVLADPHNADSDHVDAASMEESDTASSATAESKVQNRTSKQTTTSWKLTYIAQASSILLQKNVFYVNTKYQFDYAKRYLRTRTVLPRLPSQHTLQGLKLLRECWDYYDTLMQASTRSKCCSRIFSFILLGLTAVILVLTATLFQMNTLVCGDVVNYTANIDIATSAISLDFSSIASWHPSSYLTLFLVVSTLSQTFLIGLYRFHNPDQRWKAKRSMAMQMERIIWKFRTYTGPYSKAELPPNQSADDVLEKQLQTWCDATIGSADLVSTEIMKHRGQSFFKHGQYPTKEDPPHDCGPTW